MCYTGRGEGSTAKGAGGVIEVRGLTKQYKATLAVDHLSFDVRPGRVTGFLGPNGAGKSTTMRMIMGLDCPDSGHVTVSGRRYHDLPWPLRDIGALLEAKSVHPGRTAYNHLWALAQTNGIHRGRVDEVLELVGLTSVAKRRAGTFSLGMGQRLGIAAAMLGDPGVLLFDEPVNGLDPEGIRWVRTLLKHLASEGRTVLVSSHLMSEMALTADHVVVIGRGRLIVEQSMSDMIAGASGGVVLVSTPHPGTLRTALQAAGATTVTPTGPQTLQVSGLTAPQIGDLALASGVAVHELTPQVGSLEEAYMGLTQDSVEFRVDQVPAAAGPMGGEAR